MPEAVILFAHGARDPAWSQPFEAVAADLRARAPQLRVELAYLELMQPPLADAGAALAHAGYDSVSIVPLFLGAGGHVRRDLPQLVAALRQAHPAVRWTLTPAIGEIASVVAAMAQACARLALAGGPGSDGDALP